MNLKSQMAVDGAGRTAAADRSAPGTPADLFVINLCSSTTPMALAQPDAPELKRFRFFVSRRLEDRRERFRLHMGYFASLEEAEEWLGVVRDVYPGAWAGEAPGKRLRARAAAAQPAAPGLPIENAAAAVLPPTTIPSEAAAASILTLSRDVATSVAPAALPLPAPPELTVAVRESVAPTNAVPAAPPPRASVLPENPRSLSLLDSAPSVASKPAIPVQVAAAAPSAATPPVTRSVAKLPVAVGALSAPAAKKSKAVAPSKRSAPLAPLSNVREVLAALDATDSKEPARRAPHETRTPALSDTQVMKILEERRSRERSHEETQDASLVPMLRPEDTGTRRVLKEAVRNNAAVSFAVQLQWSVQPMALDRVPPLAIFSAYTLYTVEGNREGRKWYGLRLGFFSDADAAKQVAHYVRSEFTSVAVLPVSPEERGRATEADEKTQIASFQKATRATESEEITLLDDPSAAADATRVPAEPMRGAAKQAAAGANTLSPAARAAARSKKLRSKARVTERKAPQSLEETLEILGADALEIDNTRGEYINETGVRHLSVEVRKDSPFARLLTRLTERVRKT